MRILSDQSGERHTIVLVAITVVMVMMTTMVVMLVNGHLQSPAELERLHPPPVQTVLLPLVGSMPSAKGMM